MPQKPKKPYKSFPLTPHATGRFYKKVKGRFWYSENGDPDAALDQWNCEKDDWLAGRTPRRGRITLEYLVNRFVDFHDGRVQTGEISQDTLNDYIAIGKYAVEHLGRQTDPEQLRPDDFTGFRQAMAKRYALSRLGKIVTVTRQILKWGYESELLEKTPRYGPGFKTPTKGQKRIEKAKNGKKLFTRDEIRKLLNAADVKWKAIILLGINGGIGNKDITRLKLSDVGGEWLDFPRGKTGIDRRVPLWLETQAAISEAIDKRRRPKAGAEELLFVSEHGGPMIAPKGTSRTNVFGEQFRKLLDKTKVYRPRMGFGWLRHVFQTVADKAKDPVATKAIMGHAGNSISDEYREELPDDERLKAVTDCVHAWLFPVKGDEEE